MPSGKLLFLYILYLLSGGCQYTLVKHESVEISYEYTDQCLQLRTAAGCPKRLFLRLKMSTGQIDVSVYKSKNKPGPTIHVKGEDRHIPAKIGHAFFEHVGGYVIIFGNEWKVTAMLGAVQNVTLSPSGW